MTVIRGISPACPPSTKEQYAIRLLMVLHLARSFAMKRRIDAAMTGRLKQFVADIPSNADLAREFKARTGRHALDGEIEGVVVDYQRKLMASNTFHVTRQAEWFNRLLDDLEAMPVSVSYSAGRKGQYFITSDSPVVLHDRAHGRASPIGWGVGLQDADSILMPITRRLCGVAGLGLGPILGSDSVQKLNAFQFRHAERFVIAHPDTELAIVAPELLVMSRVP